MNMRQVTAQERGSEGWNVLFYTHMGCIQMPFVHSCSQKRMLICILWGHSACFLQRRHQDRQQLGGDADIRKSKVKVGIVEMKCYFHCQEAFVYCVKYADMREFQTCHLCQPGLNSVQYRLTVLSDSPTRQASRHLHTECIRLYLFIHFHVAKCCHFDEWEMELANCFHSMGQVSHALNLSILLVWASVGHALPSKGSHVATRHQPCHLTFLKLLSLDSTWRTDAVHVSFFFRAQTASC